MTDLLRKHAGDRRGGENPLGEPCARGAAVRASTAAAEGRRVGAIGAAVSADPAGSFELDGAWPIIFLPSASFPRRVPAAGPSSRSVLAEFVCGAEASARRRP